jgi:hypothetical protein
LADSEEDWWSLQREPFPEFIRRTDLPRLNLALKYLWTELREAEAEFGAGRHLDGAYLSLIASIAFLSLFKPVGQEGLFAPMAALESALWALDEGVVEPILKPPRRAKTGRVRSSALYQELKGAAVYVVRRLCDLGYRQSNALKVVAADLRRIGVKPDRGSGEITSRTVRWWCEDVAADMGYHGLAAKRCRVLLSHPANKVLGQMPPEDAKLLLRSRLSFFANAIGRKPAKEGF